MVDFILKQKLTLAVIGSFGLVAAGFAMLGEDEMTAESLQANQKNSTAAHSGNTSDDPHIATRSRKAPEIQRVQLSGNASGKTNRVLMRNSSNRSLSGKPDRQQLRESLRDAHLASVGERAAQAQQKKETGADKKPQAVAAAPAKQNKTLSEATGATPSAEPPTHTGDYRRALLAQARREAMNSDEPWKELIAIGLVQAEIKDLREAKETLNISRKLVPIGQNSEQTANALVSISQAFARIGELETALDTATSVSIETSRNQALSTIISEHVGRQEFSAAKTLVSSLSLPDYRSASLRNIAEGEACVGNSTPAMSTVALISNMSLKNDALKRIALAQARSRQWDAAIATTALIGDESINQNALADIISIRIDSGDLRTAQSAVWTLRDESARNNLFSKLARKHASLGDISSGMRTSDFINDSRVKESTMASVSVQQARRGDTSGAFSQVAALVDVSAKSQGLRDVTMEEATQRGTNAARNMAALIENPDARDASYRAIAQREAGMGNINLAMDCAQNIRADDCRVLSYAETALSSIQRTPSRQAIHILEDTTQLIPAIAQNTGKKNEAIIKLANAYALVNRLDETIGNLNHIQSESQRNYAFRQIAFDCVDRNQLENAQNLANRIMSESLKNNTLEEIALRHARNVKPEDVETEIRRFNSNKQRSQFLRGIARK